MEYIPLTPRLYLLYFQIFRNFFHSQLSATFSMVPFTQLSNILVCLLPVIFKHFTTGFTYIISRCLLFYMLHVCHVGVFTFFTNFFIVFTFAFSLFAKWISSHTAVVILYTFYIIFTVFQFFI